MFGTLGLRLQAAQPLPCLAPICARRYDVLYVVELLGGRAVQRVWIQVALAALAGLGSLTLCCGAFVAIGALLFSEGDLAIIPLYLRSQALYWIGLVSAVLFAGAGLSLPALALGARWEDALKPAVLSSPVFGAFVFFFLLSLDSRYGGFVAGAISLMALVETSVVGSLVTLQEEEGHSVAVRLGRVTVIAAVTIFCASLLAYSLFWLGAADLSSFLTPYIVAAFSWLVLPAMVAKQRFS